MQRQTKVCVISNASAIYYRDNKCIVMLNKEYGMQCMQDLRFS